MEKEKKEIICTQVRMPRELQVFLRDQAFFRKKSINSIICKCLENFKENYEKSLHNPDSMLS